MVAYHDPGLEPELSDEALGSGGNMGGQAHEGDKVLADQATGSRGQTCSHVACSACWGACVERNTSRDEEEASEPLRIRLKGAGFWQTEAQRGETGLKGG